MTARFWQDHPPLRPQGRALMKRVIAGLLLAAAFGLGAGPAGADGVDRPRKVHRWHGYSLRLPPERHVVEIVDNFGRMTIGGRRFKPAGPPGGRRGGGGARGLV